MMKRISAAILVMFLTAMSLNASTGNSDRVGFTVNEVSVAGGSYNDDYKNCPVIMASYLLGRHFNERLFAGVSAACSFSTYLTDIGRGANASMAVISASDSF